MIDQRRFHSVALFGGGLVVIAAIMLLVGWTIQQARLDAHRAAEVATANLTQTLADNFRDSIRRIDAGILVVLDEVVRQQRAGQWDEGAIVATIVRQDARHPDFFGFRIFGADGILRYGVSNIANRNADISQRDDFIFLRDHPGSGLFIGPPALGTSAQQWSITMARRIDNPDGSFGGLVTCGISLQHLAKAFAALDLGPHGIAALFHNSFQLAARFPELKRSRDQAIMVPVGDPLRAIIAAAAPATQYDYVSPLDGAYRTATIRRIEGQPYFVLVGLAEEDYLEKWRRSSLHLLLFGAIVVGLVLAGVLFLYRHLSDRMHAADALAESESRFRTIFDNINDAIFIHNIKDGSIIAINRRMLDMYAYSDESEVIGRHPGELSEGVPPYDEDGAQAWMRKAASATQMFEWKARDRNGRLFWVEVAMRHAVVGRSGDCLLAVVRDISERKFTEQVLAERTKELERSNADLEQFAYISSHDLQTPLRNMVSYAQMLEHRYKDRIDAEADEFIGFIVTGGKRMSELIADILEYSRFSMQSRPLESVSTN
ncbi:PAS domain S-box protein, partial [Magnetospirillum sp. SS-4]|uniref:PAS domain S-box protein n=1 Tax=Magnetospirillum sp. SS-4 TaxID=2681465 RepID=UPI001572C165